MMDIIRNKRFGAFGTRLRRLSERLDRQMEALYCAQGVNFQPRWFAIVGLLQDRGGMTVGELASALSITHAAVSQVRGELIKASIVRTRTDDADRRRRILELTPKGARLVEKLTPLWTAVTIATEAMCTAEIPALIDSLDQLEDALSRRGMHERTGDVLKKRATGKPMKKTVYAEGR